MDSKTHRHITKIAIDYIYERELNQHKEWIKFYSVQPDKDEREGGFKKHFYNPATRKNFVGDRESALTKYIGYYNKAEHNIRNGVKYYEEIGRSLHYLVDINTPVHTYYEDRFDAAIRLNQHIVFENYCNEIIEEIDYKKIKIDNLEYYIYNSIKDIGKNCARKSSILFYEYDDMDKKDDIDKIAREAIMNGIHSSIGILYRFINSYREEEKDD